MEEGTKDGKTRVHLRRGFGESLLGEALVKLGFEGCIGVCQISNFRWRILLVQRCRCVKVLGEFR